jgi:hypothetical protein
MCIRRSNFCQPPGKKLLFHHILSQGKSLFIGIGRFLETPGSSQ